MIYVNIKLPNTRLKLTAKALSANQEMRFPLFG
jgi:hypothetical protein